MRTCSFSESPSEKRTYTRKVFIIVITLTSLSSVFAIGIFFSRARPVSATGCWRDTICTGPTSAAFPGIWDKYNYSPSSRVVSPITILQPDGAFISEYPGASILKGNDSEVLFDFGKEVGGIVTITYSAQGRGSLGLAFSEAKNWTGKWSDGSNGSFKPDGALHVDITSTQRSNYTMPDHKLRGGFRYLTLFSETSTQVSINVSSVSVEIAYQPAWPNLRAYKGYFSCSDDLLNRIWYSGAYTLQTNSIPPNTGRKYPLLDGSWINDVNLNYRATGDTVYVDGSKRDRIVWPGDLAIAVPSVLVSTGDWNGIRNTLDVLYNDQAGDGQLPFAGPAINVHGSDTYHMASLMGTYDYFLWTNDTIWLRGIYPKYQKAMSFITKKIDSAGLLYVTGTSDWGRLKQGGRNTEANMLMYEVLVRGSKLANWTGDSISSSNWSTLATNLKTAINAYNWDTSAGAFKDTDTDDSIHPQDGNSMALAFSVALASRTESISSSLLKNWNAIGAVAPELPGNIVGFVQSFEIKGHLVARQASRALDLMRRSWGWYLNSPYGTASTCIEGYLADGTFGYRAGSGYDDYSYTSHAHGWSTGPTSALTSYIVGLTVTSPGGSTWQFAPQFGDLTHAEAGFTTPTGKFTAGWTLLTDGYSITWSTPAGTVGSYVLPGREGKAPSVRMDAGSGALVAGTYDQITDLLTFDLVSQGVGQTANVTY